MGAAMLAATQLGKDGVEVLERLHAIHKEERAFHARGEFAVAMAALKADLPPVVKSVAGQHGASRVGTRTKGMYAPLDTICSVLDPVAARHGFSYRFDREFANGKEWSLCHVTHKGGHTETTRYPAMDDDPGKGKSALHARGSGDTFARRYVLTAAFAIVTADPDDDGEAASRPDDGDRAPEETIGEEKAAELKAVLDLAPDPKAEYGKVCAWQKVKYLSDIPAHAFVRVKNAIETQRAKGWKA
jgi:hypothetical protein